MKFPAGRSGESRRNTQPGSQSSARNLLWLAAVALCSIPLAAAQQPAHGSAAPPPAAKAQATASAPATAKAPAATAKPTPPQTPQQKQLADDTAKLLTLANQLKAELDKSNKDTLSLGVVKKAEQVEKLAHKVRDEMKALPGKLPPD